MNINSTIKSFINYLGFDLIRSYKSPHITLCGLRTLPIKTIIDIGANTGQFSRYIIGIFPGARLLCFEPLPDAFRELSAWAKKKDGQVVTHNIAVGDKDEECEMYYHTDFSPSSSFLQTTEYGVDQFPRLKSQERITVPMRRLDSLLSDSQHLLNREILIKMDVQGFEERVIRGGSAIINQASACIVEVSLFNFYNGQAKFKDLIFLLGDLGFNYAGNLEQVYAPDGHVIYFDALFTKKNKDLNAK